MRAPRGIHSLFVGCCLVFLLGPEPVQAAESSLIKFVLEDAEQDSHDDSAWQNRCVVLFLSDRESLAYNTDYVWSAPIANFVKGRDNAVALARVSDVRGLPRMARGLARRMARDPENPVPLVLLDWEGTFHQRYALQPAVYHMLVFDRSHTLVLSEALQDFDPERLAGILARLETLLP